GRAHPEGEAHLGEGSRPPGTKGSRRRLGAHRAREGAADEPAAQAHARLREARRRELVSEDQAEAEVLAHSGVRARLIHSWSVTIASTNNVRTRSLSGRWRKRASSWILAASI